MKERENMSYTDKVNEQEKEVAAAYEKAQKALSHIRLQATLTDTAQAILDIERPGETVAEIIISTNTAKPASEVLTEAAAVIDNAKKEPPKKTVYRVMFGMSTGGGFTTWPTAELSPERNTFTTIGEAVVMARKYNELLNVNPGNDFYYVLAKEIDA